MSKKAPPPAATPRQSEPVNPRHVHPCRGFDREGRSVPEDASERRSERAGDRALVVSVSAVSTLLPGLDKPESGSTTISALSATQ